MKVLCCRNFGIGNMVMCTPALRALRKLYPDGIIDVIGTPEGCAVIRGSEIINRCFEDKSEVDQSEYDIVIYFNPGCRGFNFPLIPMQITMEEDYTINEMESNLNLVARLGDIGDYEQYEPFVKV